MLLLKCRSKMMKKLSFLLYLISWIAALTMVGCGNAPAARPTVLATSTPFVITVVVTATPAETSTPASTVAPTTTLTTTTGLNQTLVAAKPSNTPGPARPTATRRPVGTATATATVTALPLKYGAVKLLRPIYESSNPGDQRDERHYPSDSLSFEWIANGALGTGECYQVRADLRSNADGSTVGDAFIQCDTLETQKPSGQTVRFVLNKPNGPGPTYAALIPSGSGDLTVSWSVTIVKEAGVIASGGAYAVDGTRHKVLPLSPGSQVVSFPLKGISQ
jgi:hypothetical protein